MTRKKKKPNRKLENICFISSRLKAPAQMLTFQEECLLWRTGLREYEPQVEIRLTKYVE